jgi:hypothetical protein
MHHPTSSIQDSHEVGRARSEKERSQQMVSALGTWGPSEKLLTVSKTKRKISVEDRGGES